MLKHILILILLSLIIIFFHKQVGYAMQFIDFVRNNVIQWLSIIFAGDTWGKLVRDVVMLAGIPLAIGLIADGLYWIVKRQTLPIVVPLIWFVWIILLCSMY